MKIATIEKISTVRAHPNADRLDLVTVLGYQCVTARDQFRPGQLILFIQPDSVLPEDQSWAQPYLKYARPRVRAIKIRDQWSEGLIVPLIDDRERHEGDDVAEEFHIEHYQGNFSVDPSSVLGPLPFNIPRTDEERVENLPDDQLPWNEMVDVTKKIDGTSCSVYYSYETKKFGVCGRNSEYHLKTTNPFAEIVKKYSLDAILIPFAEKEQQSLVLRGELYGGGIQKKAHNPHAHQPLQWAIFSVYLFGKKNGEDRYARAEGDPKFYSINLAEHLRLPHVPIVERNVLFTKDLIETYSLKMDLKFGEGVVIQHKRGSLKILNKIYDSKN